MKGKHPKGTPGHRAQNYSRFLQGVSLSVSLLPNPGGSNLGLPFSLFWDFSVRTLKFPRVCSLPYGTCQERDSPLNPAPTELLATTAGPSGQPGWGYPEGSGAVP